MSKWEKATFKDVLKIVNGKSHRQVENPHGIYPIYGSGGIMGYADEYLCEPNTVVIGRKGTINKPIFVDKPFWNVDTAFGLQPNDKLLLPKYLYYFCAKFDFDNLNTTVTIPSLTKANLFKIELPLPPLPIQQKIADVLDKASILIELRKAQLEKLDLLVKSQFIEMFGDPVTNPRNILVLPWKSVFSTKTGKLDSNAMVENGSYPFFTCAKEISRIDTYAFDCEALLLSGNNAVGIYNVKHYKGKFNAYQRTYVLQLLDNSWSYALFKQQLEDKLCYLQSQSKGTNTRYLTLTILNELVFIVPQIEEQNQFSALVEQVGKVKVDLQKSLEKLELNYKSLMQKCFRGDLF